MDAIDFIPVQGATRAAVVFRSAFAGPFSAAA